MNIALIGYGKMGKAIEEIAVSRNHKIGLVIDVDNRADLTVENLKDIDVAIEFTIPDVAFDNFQVSFDANVPIVSGTTGWLHRFNEIEKTVREGKRGFFYASNFSLGVNLFFHLNKYLAQLMNKFEEYDISMEEIHHIHKLDAPSGTAITLAEDLLNKVERKNSWIKENAAKGSELPIVSIREDEVPGTHKIKYDSDIDFIEIQHVAKSRKGFALGAVLAAEYMNGKTGIHGMNDMLKL